MRTIRHRVVTPHSNSIAIHIGLNAVILVLPRGKNRARNLGRDIPIPTVIFGMKCHHVVNVIAPLNMSVAFAIQGNTSHKTVQKALGKKVMIVTMTRVAVGMGVWLDKVTINLVPIKDTDGSLDLGLLQDRSRKVILINL